ncbi:putative enoyl-CoA hydratase echA8 [compost metagenome]
MVARVVAASALLESALECARLIAAQSRTAVMLAKECVNRVDEGSLAEGLRFERRVFQATFATPDQKEGMAAFIDKRKPVFGG